MSGSFKKPTQKFAEKFFELVRKSSSIIITSHTSPDDDSIASVLSVYRLVCSVIPQEKVRIVYTESQSIDIKFLPVTTKLSLSTIWQTI